jgi:hypothetical protein
MITLKEEIRKSSLINKIVELKFTSNNVFNRWLNNAGRNVERGYLNPSRLAFK